MSFAAPSPNRLGPAYPENVMTTSPAPPEGWILVPPVAVRVQRDAAERAEQQRSSHRMRALKPPGAMRPDAGRLGQGMALPPGAVKAVHPCVRRVFRSVAIAPPVEMVHRVWPMTRERSIAGDPA